MTEFWNRKIETMRRDKIEDLQLKLFNRQLERASKVVAYQGKLPQKINALSEIADIPFTCKDDLRQNFPYGFLAVPKEKIARVNASSGTTGIPTLVYFTKKDLDILTKRSTQQFYMTGLRKGDVCQCMMGYGLFTGGFYHTSGAAKISCILPIGAGNTAKQILFLKTLKAKFAFSTPGYLQYLLSQLSDNDIQNLSLKTVVVGGERIIPSFRSLLQKKYAIEVYDAYGMSETGGPIAQECRLHSGMHIAEDQFFCEIINPDTGKNVPDGEWGELVVTPLEQEAFPLIRYRTRDITRFLLGNCPCGRTHRRIDALIKRTDDMLIINGVNVFPSQIEECIYKNLTTATNYLIHIKEKNGLKKLIIDIELTNDLLHNCDGIKKLEYDLTKSLKSYITVTPRLNFIPIGTLPEIQGKAKRVVKDTE